MDTVVLHPRDCRLVLFHPPAACVLIAFFVPRPLHGGHSDMSSYPLPLPFCLLRFGLARIGELCRRALPIPRLQFALLFLLSYVHDGGFDSVRHPHPNWPCLREPLDYVRDWASLHLLFEASTFFSSSLSGKCVLAWVISSAVR